MSRDLVAKLSLTHVFWVFVSSGELGEYVFVNIFHTVISHLTRKYRQFSNL